MNTDAQIVTGPQINIQLILAVGKLRGPFHLLLKIEYIHSLIYNTKAAIFFS